MSNNSSISAVCGTIADLRCGLKVLHDRASESSVPAVAATASSVNPPRAVPDQQKPSAHAAAPADPSVATLKAENAMLRDTVNDLRKQLDDVAPAAAVSEASINALRDAACDRAQEVDQLVEKLHVAEDGALRANVALSVETRHREKLDEELRAMALDENTWRDLAASVQQDVTACQERQRELEAVNFELRSSCANADARIKSARCEADKHMQEAGEMLAEANAAQADADARATVSNAATAALSALEVTVTSRLATLESNDSLIRSVTEATQACRDSLASLENSCAMFKELPMTTSHGDVEVIPSLPPVPIAAGVSHMKAEDEHHSNKVARLEMDLVASEARCAAIEANAAAVLKALEEHRSSETALFSKTRIDEELLATNAKLTAQVTSLTEQLSASVAEVTEVLQRAAEQHRYIDELESALAKTIPESSKRRVSRGASKEPKTPKITAPVAATPQVTLSRRRRIIIADSDETGDLASPASGGPKRGRLLMD